MKKCRPLVKVSLLVQIIIAAVCQFGNSPHSLAATEEVVGSLISGGSPYLIVYDDQQGQSGNSNREPGIYVRDESVPGVLAWKRIISGSPFPVPVRGGLLAQFPVSRHSGRFEAMHVLEGKLKIFNVNSSEEDGTVLSIGDEGPAALKHPVTGNLITPPAISSLRDLVVAEKTDPSGNLFLVVSYKARSPFGEGVTIGFALARHQKDERTVSLLRQPVLLDFEYHADALSAQSLLAETGFVSKILLEDFVRENSRDPVPVKEWKHTLKDLIEAGSPAALDVRSDQEFMSTIPVLGYDNGAIQVKKLPYADLYSGGSGYLLAVYDPFQGCHGVYNFKDAPSLSELELASPVLTGAVACHNSGVAKVASHDRGSVPARVLIQLQNDQVYLVQAVGNNTWDTLQLKPQGLSTQRKRIIDISFTPVADSHLYLVSWNFGNEKQTVVYFVEPDHNRLVLRKTAVISQEYFKQEELVRRLRKENNTILFDGYTPIINGSTEHERDRQYGAIHRLTTPHVDLIKSVDRASVQHVVPRALAVKTISNQIEYRQYEQVANHDNATGLYKPESNDNIHRAELVSWDVQNPAENDDPAVLLDQTKLQFQNNIEIDLFATIMAVKQRAGFDPVYELVLGLDSVKKYKFTNLGIIKSDIAGLRNKKISYLRFLPLRKTTSNAENMTQMSMMLLLATETSTYVGLFDVQRTAGADRFEIANTHFAQVSDSVLDLQQMKQRIRFDTNNAAFLVNDINVDESDTSYSLTSIRDNRLIHPNRLRNKPKFFTYEERFLSDIPKEVDHFNYHFSERGHQWRIWPKDKEVSDKVRKLTSSGDYQIEIFPNLKPLFEDLANPTRPARRVILVVPDDLKKYVADYPYYLRASAANQGGYWSEGRDGFYLYHLSSTKYAEQEVALESFTRMREESEGNRRAVFMATVDAMLRVGRPAPTSSTNSFMISEATISMSGHDATVEASGGHAVSQAPTMIYLQATEGRRIQLPQFRDEPVAPKFSSVLIGTKSEVESLLKVTPEAGYGLADRFEVVELQAPPRSFREKLVMDLLSRPELLSLGYQLSVEGIVREGETITDTTEIKRTLARYLVNRTETICSRNQKSIHSSFVSVLSELASYLSTDPIARSRRVIDVRILEMVLAKTFKLPLNIKYLDEDDYLRFLHRHRPWQEPGLEAAIAWHEAGYYGPLSLKMDFIKTMLNQLSASDDARSLVSSMIIIGDTGSGKTFLIRSFFEDVLKMKFFDFNGTDNKDAWVFFLQMNRVEEDRGTNRSPGMISLDEALAKLDEFLLTPNGPRGVIILDDIHLASPSVRKKFLSKIRAFQDNSTYEIRTSHSGAKEIPTRYLVPILTMNATENKEKIRNFSRNSENPSVKDLILATLSSGDQQDMEPSTISRFAKIINLSKFPEEAKAPKLAASTRSGAQDLLETDNKFVISSSQSLETLAHQFPDVDSRNFLSAARRSLTIPTRSMQSNVFLTYPKSQTVKSKESLPNESLLRFAASGADSMNEIEQFAAENIEFLPLDQNRAYDARLKFLGFLSENFRKSIYRISMLAMTKDSRIIGDEERQMLFGTPYSVAMLNHFQAQPMLDLSSINVEPQELGFLTHDERTQYQRALSLLQKEQAAQGVLSHKLAMATGGASLFDTTVTDTNLYNRMMGQTIQPRERTRRDVINDAASELQPIFERMVSAMLRMNSLSQLNQSPELWVRNMTVDKTAYVNTFGDELTSHLIQFVRKIRDPRLLENRTDAKGLEPYETMRFYLLACDEAIARLPLGKITNYIIEALKLITSNISYGQSEAVQQFLFKSKHSPLVLKDVASVMLIAETVPQFTAQSNNTELSSRFETQCKNLLSRGAK